MSEFQVNFMQGCVELALMRMFDHGIDLDDIVCLVPFEELAGPMTTCFGVIEAVYSQYLPKEPTFFLIRRHMTQFQVTLKGIDGC